MIKQSQRVKARWVFLVILCIAALVLPAGATAGPPSQGPWWEVVPEPEVPSPNYDSILYSEIAPRLREIEVNSNRVKVDVIGKSAGGRNLFLVTLSAPEALGRLGQYQAIRQTMLKDPAKAQEMVDKFGDFKVPIFINGSIHGGEYPGVDAAIRLIETLAYEDTEEVRNILDNVILLVNVVANPDGRVRGTRSNANGFDLNRDFISMSQPETQATARVFTQWNPMVVLDLHGFVNPMLIEPCTPPHNPNYEYDLYLKWAFYQAEAMEAELYARTGYSAQIPFRDTPSGWDDWSAAYTPMYAMYHGAYGHTLETPYRDTRGVDAHYWAVWGALKFVAANRQAMVRDQIEVFRRGFLDLPQMLIPDDLLQKSRWNQFNELTVQQFPAAYVIPKGAPFQPSPHQAARLVDFLLFNDVQVHQASQSFVLGGVEYPKGSYVVWMDQPKRGLANTILGAGPDLSGISGLSFYSPPAVWSHPLLWGAYRAVMQERMGLQTHPVNKADAPRSSAEGGKAAAYAYVPTSLAAFKVTNDLLSRGVTLYRTTGPFEDSGRTFGPGTVVLPADPALANELANRYALDVFALKTLPANTVLMKQQRIAVWGDEGLAHALRVLGFPFDTVTTSALNGGAILNYDVFVNGGLGWTSLNSAGRGHFATFFAAGGDYIGLRGTAIGFAKSAGILDVDYRTANGNTIVQVTFPANDPVAAGFRGQDYAFVYTPAWFTRLGTGVEVSARHGEGAFVVSGYWPGWGTSGAAGQPVVVRGASGLRDVTLIGLDITFRGHPENGFRLLGNAIYSGLD